VKVKIKNNKGFAAAQAATSTDETRPHLTGVQIESDGTVIGTNGSCIVISKDCVEPFDGDSFLLKATQMSAAQYKSPIGAEIDVAESGEGHITCWVGKTKNPKDCKRQLIVCDVVKDVRFPPWQDFDKLNYTDDGVGGISFNLNLVAKVSKVFAEHGVDQISLKTGSDQKSPVRVLFGSKKFRKENDIKMILMPMTE